MSDLTTTVCAKCGVSYFPHVPHRCQAVGDKIAQGFSRSRDESREAILKQAAPNDDLMQRLHRFLGQSDLKVDVVIEWDGARIRRAVIVEDPNLPEHLRHQERDLTTLEDWEPVMHDLGLLP